MVRRRWRKILLSVLAAIVGPPSLYAIAAFGLALIPVNRGFVEALPGTGVEIQLVSNGVHVDFLVPVTTTVMDWSRGFPRRTFRDVGDDLDHVLIGWGDRGFFLETPTWADLTFSTAVNAVFWPSASAVHVQYLRGPLVEDASCRGIRLTGAAYRRLCEFLEASFERDATGNVRLIEGRGYGDTDNFYEGTGSYHAFNTCNSWTVRGLKRAGVRTALWSPFAGGVLRHLP